VPRWLTCPQSVTHPSTNPNRCRLTLLIGHNALPLRHATNLSLFGKVNNAAADDIMIRPRRSAGWSGQAAVLHRLETSASQHARPNHQTDRCHRTRRWHRTTGTNNDHSNLSRSGMASSWTSYISRAIFRWLAMQLHFLYNFSRGVQRDF